MVFERVYCRLGISLETDHAYPSVKKDTKAIDRFAPLYTVLFTSSISTPHHILAKEIKKKCFYIITHLIIIHPFKKLFFIVIRKTPCLGETYQYHCRSGPKLQKLQIYLYKKYG